MKDLTRHRHEFEGASGLLAAHIYNDHRVQDDPYVLASLQRAPLDQGGWMALDATHVTAHEAEAGA